MIAEVWKPVVGWEGLYEVSDQGRVRSLSRIVPICRNRWGQPMLRRLRGRLLHIHPNPGGYPSVKLYLGSKQHTYMVHTLVLLAFVGPRPDGFQGSHVDGNNKNNAASNLIWEPLVDNHARKREHGTLCLGEKHGLSKLTDAQVREIKLCLGRKQKHADIAGRYGVTREAIGSIAQGRNWGWLV